VEFLDESDGGLFCVRHVPESPPVGSVVVCSPIAAEADYIHRTEVLLGRFLAARGILVQRFQYRGMGNSAGRAEELSFHTMCEDASRVVERVRRLVPGAPVAFVGTRVGAMVAAAAAAATPGAPLVLWEPTVDSRRYFQEVFRAYMVGAMGGAKPGGETGAVPDPGRVLREEGMIEVMGYPVHRPVYETLLPESLEDLVASGGPRPLWLVQIARRQELRPDYERLIDDWRAMGLDPTFSLVDSRPIWWAKPGPDRFVSADSDPDTRVLLEATADWVGSAVADARVAAPDDRVAGATEISSRPGSSTHRPVWFDAAGNELFGLLTEPTGESRGIGVTVLGGGGNDTTSGHGRRWNRLARSVVERGFHCMRFNYHGIGESDGQVENFVLDRPFLADVSAAVQRLGEAGIDRHVLVGFCFGGRGALEWASRDESVVGVALGSVPLGGHGRGEGGATRSAFELSIFEYLRTYLRKIDLGALRDPGERRRYLRIARSLISVKARKLTGRGRQAPDPAPWVSRKLLRELEVLVEREVPVLFLYGDEEIADFEEAREGSLGDLLEADSTQLAVEPGRLHGGNRETQDGMIARVVEWLEALVEERGTATGRARPRSRRDVARGEPDAC